MADMLFDYLKAITVNKDETLPLDDYSPFLISRWISFINPATANMLNCTVNQLGSIDKRIHYKLMLSVIPKSKFFKKINYLKKAKKEKDDKEQEKIKQFAECNEISVRELEQMIEMTEKLSNKS